MKSEEAPEPRSGACGKRSGCPETTAELRSRSSEGEGEPRACLGAGRVTRRARGLPKGGSGATRRGCVNSGVCHREEGNGEVVGRGGGARGAALKPGKLSHWRAEARMENSMYDRQKLSHAKNIHVQTRNLLKCGGKGPRRATAAERDRYLRD